MQSIKFFNQLVLLSFKQQTTYRTAMWAGLATNLFFGLLRAAVLLALYNSQEMVNGMSIDRALTYTGLSQALIAFLVIFGNYDLMRTVYSGAVSTDLLKPANYFLFWMGKEWGSSIFNLFFRGILFMLLFSVFFPVVLPNDIIQWLWFVLSLVLSWLVSFAWRFLVNLSAFWTPDAVGIGRLAFTLSQVLSGFIFPLRLYPEWFARFCMLTPFPSLLNTPGEVFLGTISGSKMVSFIFLQLIWFVVLTLLALLVFRAGIRKLVIQGG